LKIVFGADEPIPLHEVVVVSNPAAEGIGEHLSSGLLQLALAAARMAG
jgi:hypothetical protein